MDFNHMLEMDTAVAALYLKSHCKNSNKVKVMLICLYILQYSNVQVWSTMAKMWIVLRMSANMLLESHRGARIN